MRYRIARINIWSAVKVAFVIFTVLALAIGFIWSLIFFAIGGLLQEMMPDDLAPIRMMRFPGFMIFFMSVIIAPIYGVIAALGVAIVTFFYNAVAGWTGGVTMELQSETIALQPAPRTPVAVSPDIDYDTGN